MKKRFAALDATVIILSAACIALCVALALVKPTYLVFVVGVLLVVGIVVGLNIRWFRHRLARLLHGASDASSAAQGSFAAMSVPVVILTGGSVAWYNDAFRDDVMGGQGRVPAAMSKVVPAFMPALAKEKTARTSSSAASVIPCTAAAWRRRRPVRGLFCQQYHAQAAGGRVSCHTPCGDAHCRGYLRRDPQGNERERPRPA